MKKELIRIAMSVVVFAALFGLLVPVQAQPYTVQGYVYDTVGTPVDDVNVTIMNLNTSDSLSDTTKWGGFYSVVFGWPATPVTIGNILQINATYPCMTNTTTVTATGSPQTVNLILQAETTPPTIINLLPADGSFINNAKPTISANYSDDSGINVSSIEMRIDGNIVTLDSLSETDVSYTPAADLDEGSHTVTVNVSDNCTNQRSTNWSFTVDTMPPTVLFISPTPANESTNTTGYVNFTVNVSDPVPGSGLEDIINVSVWNETGIYLNNKTMQAFDEHKYYYYTPLPNGNYTYRAYAKDVAGNTRVSETRVVTVNVTEYTVSVSLESGYNMISLPVNDTSVTNASLLMDEIGANCTEIFKWNKTSQGWESYNQYMPPAAAFDIVGGEGYFMSMSGPATVEFRGMGWESPFSISLVTGYNTISLPVNDPSVINASLLMDEIGANCTEIFKWNKTSQGWESYNQYMPPAAAFDIVGGDGYFMSMVGPADVTFMGEPWRE